MIKTTEGLQFGNLIKTSNSDYWGDKVKGLITVVGLDELRNIEYTQHFDPSGSTDHPTYEYLELNDMLFREFGFEVMNNKVHIVYNAEGNIFQLNRISIFRNINDQNSHQIEAAINRGEPIATYEFTWGAVQIKYAHQLQNLFCILGGRQLIRKPFKS